jgi:predicted CopG family antitoxin
MLWCASVRTTITIDDDLYRRAKTRAAQEGRSVSDFIADAVRQAVKPRRRDAAELVDLPVAGGSGVLPGVDLTDPSALADVMDHDVPLDALR